CLDDWSQADSAPALERFRRNIGETGRSDQVEVLRARSRDGLHDLRSRGVEADLVYVDGSHAACDVLSDLVQSFQITRVGGVIICDDYLWRGRPERPRDIVD